MNQKTEPKKAVVKAAKAKPTKPVEAKKVAAPKPALLPLKLGQIAVDAKRLLHAVRLADRMTDSHSGIVAISHLHITVGKEIEIVGGLAPECIAVQVPILKGVGPFEIGVRGKLLASAISETRFKHGADDVVVLSFHKQKEGYDLQVGEYSQIKLVVLSEKDQFSELPKMDGKVIAEGILKEGKKVFGSLLPFTSDEDSRLILQSVCVKADVLAATDGRRLAVIGSKNCNAELTMSFKDKDVTELLIPGPFAEILRDLEGEVKLTVRTSGDKINKAPVILAETTGIQLYGQTFDGSYPNFHQVMPDPKTYQFHKVSAIEIDKLVRTTEVVQTDKREGEFTTLTLGRDCLTLSAHTGAGEANNLNLPVKNGKDCKVAVKSAFLRDCVRGAGTSEVEIGFMDELSPLLVSGTDGWFKAVVMPIRRG